MSGVFLSLISSGFYESFTDDSVKLNDFFNEVIIVFTLYTVMCFSGFVPSALMEFNVGYVSCGLIIIHLVVNLVIMINGSMYKLVLRLKRFFYQRKLKQQKMTKVTEISDLA